MVISRDASSIQVLINGDDLTTFVDSVTIDEVEERQASSASLSVINKNGTFDRWGDGQFKNSLLEDNPIVIKRNDEDDELSNNFTGYVARAKGQYVRGSEGLNVECLDNSKPFYRQKVTTKVYEDRQINDILENASDGVLIIKALLTASDIDLDDDLDYTVAKTQFVNRYIMDIVHICMETQQYYAKFNRSGVLISYPAIFTGDADYEYGKADAIELIDFGWSDNFIKNRANVTGRLIETASVDVLGDEIEIASGNFVVSQFTKTEEQAITYSTKCEPSTVRLERIGSGIFSKAILKNRYDSEATIYVTKKDDFYGADQTFHYKLHGQPYVTQAGDQIQAFAQYVDADLVTAYKGRHFTDEVENSLLQTDADCTTLGNWVIDKHKLERYPFGVKIAYGTLRHNTGDKVIVYNPRIEKRMKMYVNGIHFQFTRGREDSTMLNCFLIEVL